MGARSSTLHANVASENAISGIVAGGERNRLQSNRTEGNPAHGIRLAARAAATGQF